MIDGTEQRDRLLPALKEGYFDVDDLRFEQLVAMSTRLASKLAFYSLDNKTEYDPHGKNADDWRWAGLFRSDEALVLAQIMSRDIEPERAHGDELLKLKIGLEYTIRTTNTRMNVVYPFYLREGASLDPEHPTSAGYTKAARNP